MTKHWRYLKYVLRHKWFVLQEGRKLGVPLWQLVVHDWSKFLPDEWRPYAEYFYGGPHQPWAETPAYAKTHHFDAAWNTSKEQVRARFDVAWLKHQHRSPHHWQYWVLHEDPGDVKVLPMPDRYRREMLADWRGAGRAIHGKDDTAAWYERTKEGRLLHPDTQAWVEQQLYPAN